MNFNWTKVATWFSLVWVVNLLNIACNSRLNSNNHTLNNSSHRNHIQELLQDQISLEKLSIAVIPHLSSSEQAEKIQLLDNYLEKSLGLPVEIQVTKNYQKSVDLLVEGKVEMAYLGAVTYIKARERNPNLEAILAPIDKTTGRPWYTSVIVANTTKSIKTSQDLVNKRFSFVNQSSTSGYLMPSMHFQEQGINPEQDFASIQYAGSHDKNLAALQSEVVDAIAIDKKTYLRQEKSGKIDSNKYQIIWESEPIPSTPLVISNQLPSVLITAIKRSLIQAPEGLVSLDGSDSFGYTLVEDEDYELIRQMLKSYSRKQPQLKQ